MGKPGGGSSGSTIFTTKVFGPPPGPLTVGADLWIDLGVIPVSQRIWWGSVQCSSPYKSTTFEIRSNLTSNSVGTNAATLLHGSIVSSPKSGTKNLDLYKSGTLHTTSVYGTGVEHFWLRLKSTSSVEQSYLYTLNYTLE